MSYWWKLFTLRDQLKIKKENHTDKQKEKWYIDKLKKTHCSVLSAVLSK